MAQLLLVGPFATVELTRYASEDGVYATCVKHSSHDVRIAPADACDWVRHYDDMHDATEYAADHADKGDPS